VIRLGPETFTELPLHTQSRLSLTMDSSTDLILWQGPMLQDFEIVDIQGELLWTPPALSTSSDTGMLDGVPHTLQDVEGTAMSEESLWALPALSASSGIEMLEDILLPALAQPAPIPQVNRTRCRPYTDEEWTQIRPVFTQLYIEKDMILRDVIQNLKEHYGFHPTEKMCKNRIRAWSLSKNSKAAEKEDALQKLLEGSSPTVVYQKIRPDKLVRYYRSRYKQDHRGARATKIVKQTRSATIISCSGIGYLGKSSSDSKMMRSLAMPDHFADMDLFLRAIKSVVFTQDAEINKQHSSSYLQIRNMLGDGVTFWISHASIAARLRFSQAAEVILEDLKNGTTLDVRLLDWLTPETWGSKCQSIFREFTHFLSRVMAQYLGKQHPSTVIARYLHGKDIGKDERLTMWSCIINGFDPTQPMEQWWSLARRRWDYCRDVGMHGLAVQYCREAESLMRESKQLTITMEIETLLDLGQIYFDQAEDGTAEEYLSRSLEVAQINVEKYWRYMSLTLFFLAEIHTYRSEVSQAQKFHEQALELALQFGGMEDADTVNGYRDLLCFYQRNGLLDEIVHAKEQYAELHNHVEEITEGLWSVELDDDSAEAERSDDSARIDHGFTGY